MKKIIFLNLLILSQILLAQETVNCAKKFNMPVIPEVNECEAAEKGNTGINQGYLECVCKNKKLIAEGKTLEQKLRKEQKSFNDRMQEAYNETVFERGNDNDKSYYERYLDAYKRAEYKLGSFSLNLDCSEIRSLKKELNTKNGNTYYTPDAECDRLEKQIKFYKDKQEFAQKQLDRINKEEIVAEIGYSNSKDDDNEKLKKEEKNNKTKAEETTELYGRLNEQYNSMIREAEKLKTNGKRNSQTYSDLLKRIRSTEVALNIPRHKAFDNSNFVNENTGNKILDNTSRKINNVKEISRQYDNVVTSIFGDNLRMPSASERAAQDKRYNAVMAQMREEAKKRKLAELKRENKLNKLEEEASQKYNLAVDALDENTLKLIVRKINLKDHRRMVKWRQETLDEYPTGIFEENYFWNVENIKLNGYEYDVLYIFNNQGQPQEIVKITPVIRNEAVHSSLSSSGGLFYKESGYSTFTEWEIGSEKEITYGLFNKYGKIITLNIVNEPYNASRNFENKSEEIDEIFPYHVIVKNLEGKYGVVDISKENLEVVIPFDYTYLDWLDNSHGLLTASISNKNFYWKGFSYTKKGVIDIKNNKIVNFNYPIVENLGLKKGVFKVKKKLRGSNYSYYNYDGKRLSRKRAYE